MVYPALHAHISLVPLKLRLTQLQNQPNSTSPDEVLNFITEIFETLTSTENVSFRRLFDRMVYASERLNISPASLKPLHRFRIQHKQFTKGAPFPHALIAHTIAALTTLFAQLDGLPTGDVAAVQSEQRTHGTSFQNLKVVLVSKGKLEHDNRGVAWFTFQAVQEDQDPDCSSCQVIIRDIRPNSGNSIDFAYLHPLLRPFVTLRLLQFRATTKGDQIILENSYDSQVVLEPDFLVDASELAQCIKFKSADDPNSYFLRKLIPREAGGAAFQGTVINFVLDEIVAQPEEFDYTKSFKHAIKQQSLKAVNLGREAIAEFVRPC